MKWSKHISANYNSRGFTLVELLIAMVVTSIILSAVATLAYAFGAAYDAGDDTTRKQAQVRYATLRISELFRNCRLVFGVDSDGLGVWRADDDGNDEINIEEAVYVNKGAQGDRLEFLEASAPGNPVLSANFGALISQLTTPPETQESTILVPQCSNVQFVTDATPPYTRSVSISFDIEENGVTHHYQINTTLRAWAGNLLDSSGNFIISDDD